MSIDVGCRRFWHRVCKSSVTVSLVVNNRVMVHPSGREIWRMFFIFPERIVIFTRFIISYVMDKGRIISGLAIMAGLIVLGIMLPRSVGKFREYERVVNVKGLCEREVKADKVIWPVVYKVMANDVQAIYDQIDAGNEIILDFLEAGGISPSEITVSVPQISDKLANEYGDSNRQYRYIAKNVITVCTSDVDTVLSLMSRQSELLRKGIVTEGGSQWENPVEFRFEGLNEVKPGMIEEATRNARETALKFAKDSDSRLGKIKTASQGTFSIDDRDSNTPYIKKVRVVTSVTYYLKN